ncbi:MAG TPA: sensor domain-containing diguanylate cyclase [Desulfuromonadales bacterium]|nr:sensor domain-containing diguanylate cyclase [Desulfuromonadales bacterium]
MSPKGGRVAVDRPENDLALIEEVKGLKNLLSVAQVVVSSLNLGEVLQNILHSAMAIMDFPAGSIALYEESEQTLVLHAHAGLSEKFVARDRWRVKEGGLTHGIIDFGEPFVVEDVAKTNVTMNPLALEEGIQALIAVPLIFQKNLVGILYVDDFQPRTLDRSRLRLLSVLASFATMSIDNARLHLKTLELASTDGLTGLLNHRQFKKDFCEELRRAERYHTPLSIVLLDVDNFKKFNDLYGHPCGDVILRELAALISELLRDCDLVYRYGGEEFVALLPETGLDEALLVAGRIRSSVEEKSPLFLKEISPATGVTVSIGVASFPEDGSTVEHLLQRVDDLMYMAKSAGKNKVHHRDGLGQITSL